jgi:hypothetical protein
MSQEHVFRFEVSVQDMSRGRVGRVRKGGSDIAQERIAAGMTWKGLRSPRVKVVQRHRQLNEPFQNLRGKEWAREGRGWGPSMLAFEVVPHHAGGGGALA